MLIYFSYMHNKEREKNFILLISVLGFAFKVMSMYNVHY